MKSVASRMTHYVYPPAKFNPRICHDCGEVLSEIPDANFTQCEKCLRHAE